MTTTRRIFMLEEVPRLLASLQADTEPRFGLMTPQHMVEHIANDAHYITQRQGEPEGPPTERQLGFQKFIEKGAILKHRPSDKTKADLPELKYASLAEAVAKIGPIPQAFYAHYDAHPDFKVYNKFMGELGLDMVELFVSQHWRYHLWQFKLIDQFP